MWSAVASSSETASPSARSKHSAAVHGGDIYLLGGRNGNLPLKDFWRYRLRENKWEQLRPSGDCPPSLQEHTAVVHKDFLYIFGGEVGFSAENEIPLWIYNIKENSWKKFRSQPGANVPRGRRGHSALLFRNSMLMYGGYRDLKGSSNELWAFHFETESWHLLSCGKNAPPGRHKHSAICHENALWIYGGMTDLHDRADLWRYDLQRKQWTPIKCKISPGSLHSHAACRLPSSMILFGGERGGQPNNELWRFHFESLNWEKLATDGVKPHPRSESIALIVSELLFSNESNEEDQFLQSPDHNNTNVRPLTQKNINVFDKNNWSHYDNKLKDAITPNSNRSILREVSKLSHKNIPLLSQNRCSYTALDNGSNESLTNSESEDSPDMGESLMHSKRSQSTNLVTRSAAMSPMTPNNNVDVLRTFQLKRDNSSVPNFNSLALLTPVEVTKLVYLDGEEAPMTPKTENFSSIHQRFHPNNTKLNNRRSYPSASVRFSNPLTTPEETSDYASLETVSHQNENLKWQRSDSVKSFSNPNYMGPDVQSILSKKKDYNLALNSPVDSLLEDRVGRSKRRPDTLEMKPIPPRSLSLVTTKPNNKLEQVKRRNNRCSSSGRYEKTTTKSTLPPPSLCILLIGGKEKGQVTVFRRPLSVWKLTLPRHIC